MEHSEKRVYRDSRWRLKVGEKKRVISRSTQFDKEDINLICTLREGNAKCSRIAEGLRQRTEKKCHPRKLEI